MESSRFVRCRFGYGGGYFGAGTRLRRRGIINHSIAGATVALPLDGSGAMYWNPATIGDLEFGEVQFGFGRVAAPWFGDESFAAGVLVPLGAVLWLYAAANSDEDDNDFRWWDKRTRENTDSVDWKQEHPLAFPKVRGINFSFVAPPRENQPWNFGFAMAETGSRKIHFVADPETGKAIYGQLYRVKTIEFTPTISRRLGKRLLFGFSPIMSITEFPGASFPTLPGNEWNGTQDTEHCGFGIQLGMYYRTKNNFNFGFSVRSPHRTSAQHVQWINGSGDILERKLRYSTEYPTRYVFGISYTGFERIKGEFDIRLYDFQHLASFYGITGSAAPKRVVSYAAGFQWTPGPSELPFSLRFGYQFDDSSVGWSDYYFNSAPPIAHGHSIHYGISIGKRDEGGFEISFSLSHSFGGRGPRLQTETASQSFKRNPNNNAFWWNVRYRF